MSLARSEAAAVVELLPVAKLRSAPSPRIEGIRTAHVRTLMELEGNWPPILVTRTDLVVVDGHHRLLAAKSLGMTKIECMLFDASPAEAFLESIRVNVRHGLPLTLRERKHAARKVVNGWREWSDRRIAQLCGLSPGTIGLLRKTIPSSTDTEPVARIGRDGRRRAVDPNIARESALHAIQSTPEASSRRIARTVGVSASTVSALRKSPPSVVNLPVQSQQRSQADHENKQWERDPAYTATTDTREFADWFSRTNPGKGWERYASAIPLSRIYDVVDESRRRAQQWALFASHLESSVQGRAGAKKKPRPA